MIWESNIYFRLAIADYMYSKNILIAAIQDARNELPEFASTLTTKETNEGKV